MGAHVQLKPRSWFFIRPIAVNMTLSSDFEELDSLLRAGNEFSNKIPSSKRASVNMYSLS
jgi:hypothetical protein